MRSSSPGNSVSIRVVPAPSRAGAALVIALVILAVLSMLGAPFAASMLLRRRQSMRASTVTQLRNAATDLRNRARAHLLATHEDRETQDFDATYPPREKKGGMYKSESPLGVQWIEF